MTTHDVICISSIDWDFIWQGHQEIMTRLAERGHRVLFIENTGVRPPRFSDLPRLSSRLRNWRRGTKGFREERRNLFIHSPIVLPLPYSRIAQWLNRRVLMQAINRWMRAIGASRPVVWTFLPTPLARDLIAAIDPAVTIYYCIDDLASSSREARKIVKSEQALFGSADLVFVTSEKLRQRAAQFSERVHLFPFAVNLAVFQKSRDAREPMPADLAALKRPVAGYVGGLHQWVDQDLLAAIATKLPKINFALIGPAQTDVSKLKALPNVHLFGQRPHAELPRYVSGFDVGLVPYRITEYTANVYPTKLNEYLVMGIPVVATDLNEIRRFNSEHGALVNIADGADAFAAAVKNAVATVPLPSEVSRRIEVAESNSWERRLETMSALIDAELMRRMSRTTGWEDRLRRLYGAAKAGPAKVAGAALILYLLLFQTPLVWWLAEPLRVAEAPRRSDAIVVFAGGVGETGEAQGGAQERIGKAVALYHEGVASRLIISSGFVFTLREAEVMKAIAVSNGVPADAILLEERAANTYENVAFTNRILQERNWRRIALVSSPYHMRRAVLTWRKVAPQVEVVATPPEASLFYAHSRGASLEQIRGLLQEYAAIVYYWWAGRI
ncbi:MAG TPA: ElyC/SanA/YdcF family protein [Vicinamibacterales bacterium]|nr:ElyC/SanA/YdcF family protein [Vicinamibacterales bacterium]